MAVTGTNISLTLRDAKGAALTHAELDGNQTALKDAIEQHAHDDFIPGPPGLDASEIISAAFVVDDLVFTKEDTTEITIVGAKTALTGAPGADGADGASIVAAAFVADDLVFTRDDAVDVTIVGGKTALTGATGAAGTDGDDGAAATIAVGTVTTVASTAPATVINSGTSSAAIFDFEIPQGDMTNPMTATGDIIVGGTAGAPTRLPMGTSNQILKVNSAGTGLEYGAGGGGGSMPVGSIVRSGNTAPDGTMLCDGSLLNQAAYPDLYSVIGDLYSYQIVNNGKPWKQQWDLNFTMSTDIQPWTTGTSLPSALHASQAIVTNSRVYLLGGANSSSYVSTVYTAPINPDGTLGTWTTGTSLPGALDYSQAIVTNSRVYLLGGANSSAVYTAPINPDGTLGTWTTGTSLPGALGYSQAVVTNSRVYLLGGHNGSTAVSTVYTAPINPDGTLGTWTTGTSLPGALYASQAIVTNSRVYLLGGHNGSTAVSTVYTAAFSGGFNDYLDKTYIASEGTGQFRVPDTRWIDQVTPRLKSYIKV